MKPINLTTLFTSPVNNTAFINQTGFKGSDIRTFNYNEINRSQDNFVSNPLYTNFEDAKSIEKAAKSNPRIMQLLKENGIKLRVNVDELKALKKGHLNDTRVIAAKICSNITNPELKQQVNMQDVQQAAMLHDYGKVLIPEKILNKPGALTPDERKIIQLHSELGYELLKQQGINDNVLRLVKYHHQNEDGSGYLQPGGDFEYDINIQILHVADMYSALTEDRCYHKACTKDEALKVIYENVESGLVSQEVFDALKRSL